MGQTNPHLEWLSRRRDGESCALIAHHAGVSEPTVGRATEAFGPFPYASRQLRRTFLTPAVLDARQRRWVEARRQGRSIMAIAKEEGVAHQTVSAATKDFGPFPSAKVVRGWADARKNGETLATIADAAGVTVGLVRRMTRPLGPFSPPGPKAPSGVETVESIARRARVEAVTVLKWRQQGRLPEIDFITA